METIVGLLLIVISGILIYGIIRVVGQNATS